VKNNTNIYKCGKRKYNLRAVRESRGSHSLLMLYGSTVLRCDILSPQNFYTMQEERYPLFIKREVIEIYNMRRKRYIVRHYIVQ
jgi:hypothetical protein